MLREAGPAGCHTFELRAAYVANPSQRIAELEDAGHTITHTREKLHGSAVGTRYRLVQPQVVLSEAVPLGVPQSAIFDWDEAA